MTFPDGFHRPASARYVIEVPHKGRSNENSQRRTVDESALSRERGAFSKVVLRSFLRNTVKRDSRIGAPWLVKDTFAEKYRIASPQTKTLSPKDEGEKKPSDFAVVLDQKAKTIAPETIDPGQITAKNLVEDLNLPSGKSKRPRLGHELPVSNALAQQLLEVWAFFNVFLEVLTLDSFTLDDFGDALGSTEKSELVDELFCSLLQAIRDDQSSPLGLSENASDVAEDAEDQDTRVPRGFTGSAGDAVVPESISDSDLSETTNGRAELAALVPDWKTALRAREFGDDRYWSVLLGMFIELSSDSDKPFYREVFDHMTSSGSLTVDRLPIVFRSLPADLKLQSLLALVDLTWQTNLVRQYIDECMENLTLLRKERADAVKEKKSRTDAIYQLRLKMRAQFPRIPTQAAAGQTREEQLKQGVQDDINGSRQDSSDVEIDEEDPEEDSVAAYAMSTKRRISSRLSKQLAIDVEVESNDDSVHTDSAKIFRSRDDYEWEIQKVKKSVIKAEHRIQRIDEEFRESDAQRLRKLGQDRYWNTYWWLESCGMPVYGMPNCSTSHAGFASGRIFVQGPSRHALMELEQRSRLHEFDYAKRRAEDEGDDALDVNDWGFYDHGDQVTGLLHWLDPRGTRESKLRSAIELRAPTILRTMHHRARYLFGTPVSGGVGAVGGPGGDGAEQRRSARHTGQDNHDGLARFERWKNTMARKTLGRPHSGEVKVKGVAVSKKRKR